MTLTPETSQNDLGGESRMKDQVEIAMAADEGYADLMLVAAASVAMSAHCQCRLVYTFLDGGFSDTFYNQLTAKIRDLHQDVSFRRFRVDANMFSDFPDWRGNKMAYARFLLPSLLPDVTHVIYCDVDFVWMRNIAELWGLRDDNVVLQAVRDPQVKESPEPQWFVTHGYIFPKDYFCTGLLMMNLELFRKECIVERVYKIIAKHPDILFPDQGSLNILLAGRVKMLDPSWMYFTRYVDKKRLQQPCVLHYVNDVPIRPKVSEWTEVRDLNVLWHYVDGCVRGTNMFDSMRKWRSDRFVKHCKMKYFLTRCCLTRWFLLLAGQIKSLAFRNYLMSYACFDIAYFQKMFLGIKKGAEV